MPPYIDAHLAVPCDFVAGEFGPMDPAGQSPVQCHAPVNSFDSALLSGPAVGMGIDFMSSANASAALHITIAATKPIANFFIRRPPCVAVVSLRAEGTRGPIGTTRRPDPDGRESGSSGIDCESLSAKRSRIAPIGSTGLRLGTRGLGQPADDAQNPLRLQGGSWMSQPAVDPTRTRTSGEGRT